MTIEEKKFYTDLLDEVAALKKQVQRQANELRDIDNNLHATKEDLSGGIGQIIESIQELRSELLELEEKPMKQTVAANRGKII